MTIFGGFWHIVGRSDHLLAKNETCPKKGHPVNQHFEIEKMTNQTTSKRNHRNHHWKLKVPITTSWSHKTVLIFMSFLPKFIISIMTVPLPTQSKSMNNFIFFRHYLLLFVFTLTWNHQNFMLLLHKDRFMKFCFGENQ